MIRLTGKHPERDIQIVYTGLRAGEKLFEELFHPQESYQPTGHPKIMLAQPRELPRASLETALHQARQAVLRYDRAVLDRLLQELVPEFVPGSASALEVVSINRAPSRARDLANRHGELGRTALSIHYRSKEFPIFSVSARLFP